MFGKELKGRVIGLVGFNKEKPISLVGGNKEKVIV
jgi:hypothetical protein